MAKFKEWTVTLTITETAVDKPEPSWGPEFYSAPQLKHEIRNVLEEKLKGCRVEQAAVLAGSEYYA